MCATPSLGMHIVLFKKVHGDAFFVLFIQFQTSTYAAGLGRRQAENAAVGVKMDDISI